MPERDNYPRSDEMTPTGQFRAMPDASQNTAQFRAFTRKYENEGEPWAAPASGRRPANRTAIVIGVLAVLVVAIVLAVTFG